MISTKYNLIRTAVFTACFTHFYPVYAQDLDFLSDNIIVNRSGNDSLDSNAENTVKTTAQEQIRAFSPELKAASVPVTTRNTNLSIPLQQKPISTSQSKQASGNGTVKRNVEWAGQEFEYDYKTVSFKIDSRDTASSGKDINSVLTSHYENGWEIEMTRSTGGETPLNTKKTNGQPIDYVTSYVDYRLKRKK